MRRACWRAAKVSTCSAGPLAARIAPARPVAGAIPASARAGVILVLRDVFAACGREARDKGVVVKETRECP